VPWSKAANEDGTFKSDDDPRAALRRRNLRRPRSRPSRTAASASAHTPVVLASCSATATSNYDQLTEYGSLIGADRARDGAR
jgi:thiosulfate/3-mercaptopyruvate sulfurtransferase